MSIKPRNRKEIFLNALADGKAPNVAPRTREEKFLMEQAQRESKGTSWNDLTDKPFGVKTEMVEILPEQSVTGEYVSEENVAPYPVYYAASFLETQGSLLENGKTYVFNFNGKNYNITAEINIEDESFDITILGQQVHFMGYSTGNGAEWMYNIYYSTDIADETITLAIYEEQEVVEKLDLKFLPSAGVHIIMHLDDSLSCNLTYDELNDLFAKNQVYFGSYVFLVDGSARAYSMLSNIIKNNNNGEFTMEFVSVDTPTAKYEFIYSPTDGLYNPNSSGGEA